MSVTFLTNEDKELLEQEIAELKKNGTGGGSVDAALFRTVSSNNLFDPKDIVTSFIDKNGNTATGTFTNYIKIDRNKRYVTNLHHTQFHSFDENKVHLATTTYITNPQVITGNGGYLLVKLGSDYSDKLVLEGTDIDAYHESYSKLNNDHNKWFGKKWLCIGDSISTDESNLAKNGYAKLISRELGMVLTNIAVSGKVMKDGYEWLDNCSDEYDLITVMLGTNNHGYNCALGTLNDNYYTAGTYNSNNSFYAQTQLMYEKLHEKYPKSVIMFLTPIKRTAPNGNNNDAGYQINALTLTTESYRDVIEDVCNYYSIPCVDLYNCIDPRTETNRTLYFMSASDGTHPNDLGHALFLAPVIKDAIEKQAPYYFNEWNNNGDNETGGEDTEEPEEPSEVTYTITRNLTDCVSSSNAATITKGSSHSETLTANEGYTLEGATVSVTMGGADISSSYIDGLLNIESVTGNIVITASAVVESTEEDTTPVLMHSYSGTPVEFVENDTTYTMLEDLTNNLDLKHKQYFADTGKGNTSSQYTYLSDVNISADDWIMEREGSFSIKITKYNRISNYFSHLAALTTGILNGYNVIHGLATTSRGRFTLGIIAPEGSTSVFGTGRLSLKYFHYNEESSKMVETTLRSDVSFAKDETHDIVMTFDATTKNVKVYQDAVVVIDEILDTNLAFDGINFGGVGATACTIESLEIYKGIIEVA